MNNVQDYTSSSQRERERERERDIYIERREKRERARERGSLGMTGDCEQWCPYSPGVTW